MVLEGLIRVHEKPIYRGGLPKNEGGLGPSADLRGGAWQEIGGWCF